ncbi:porin [Halomonas sp. PBN3]|uniref:porin n=1 Tax=Halomonas sp. PBN3 TaxID=1397528 RepID=UPI0003B83329|nr:porin [Halomonas sp. PBN3]ERS89487.1 hypothetical protein Q671_00875 [Halomonas sp. PBN3]
MKKTLLATAIAGALAASGAQAATIYNEDGTKLDLYGNIQLAYSSVENGEGSTEDELFDNGSTVGINASHMITRDLTAYMKAEWEHDVDEAKIDDGIENGDQAYVGVKGNFGDLRVGSWDPIIDDWAQDKITNNEFVDVSDSSTDAAGLASAAGFSSIDREGDKVQYASPSFGGFDFALGVQYKGDAEDESGFSPVEDGYTSQDDEAAFFGGVRYTVGGLQLAAIYDSLDNYTFESAAGDLEAEAYALSAVYGFGATTLAAKYERTDLDYGSDDGEVDRYGLSARHGFNFGDVYGGYQFVDAQDAAYIVDDNAGTFNNAGTLDTGGDEEYNEFLIGATYNLSASMYLWAEAGVYDREEDADDFVATGVLYSF